MREKDIQQVTRLNKYSDLVCNMILDWGQKVPPCRDIVKNNPTSIMNHMVKKHGYKVVPPLVVRDIITCKPHPKTKTLMTRETYLIWVEANPKEWFYDNQFDYSMFKKHFKRIPKRRMSKTD